MQFIKHKDDKNMNWLQRKKRFESVDRRTADFIQTVTGIKVKFNSNEEVVNMNHAWNNSINEAKKEAISENVKSLYKNGVSIEQICKWLGLEEKFVTTILKS